MAKLKTIAGTALFAVLLFWGTALTAQEPVAQALLDSAKISIGDQVKMVFRIQYSKNALFQRADFVLIDSLAGIEVVTVDTPRTRTVGNLLMTEQVVTLTSFDAGRYTLPPVPIFVAEGPKIDSAWTQELVLEVKDVSIKPDSLYIEPIKDIIVEPTRFMDYWPYWGAALLGLLLLGLWRFSKRPVKEKVYPKVIVKKMPHEIALAKLYALQTEQPWLQAGVMKAYYDDLTFITREYLENRYGIKALESTTGEILAALRRVNIPQEAAAILPGLLQTADMVKFAKANPDSNTGETWLERAITLVQMTMDANSQKVVVRDMPAS